MAQEYTDGDYRVIEHDSGVVERVLIAPVAPPQGVMEVSAAQALTALDEAGYLVGLLAWVDTLPAVRKLQFERIQGFRRDSAFLNEGAAALGLTEEQVDALFAAASVVEI